MRLSFQNELTLAFISRFGDRSYSHAVQLHQNSLAGLPNIEFRRLISDLIASATFGANVISVDNPDKFASEVIALITQLGTVLCSLKKPFYSPPSYVTFQSFAPHLVKLGSAMCVLLWD
jgi:hypothetical protein